MPCWIASRIDLLTELLLPSRQISRDTTEQLNWSRGRLAFQLNRARALESRPRRFRTITHQATSPDLNISLSVRFQFGRFNSAGSIVNQFIKLCEQIWMLCRLSAP